MQRGRPIKRLRVREVAEAKGMSLDDVAFGSGEKYTTVQRIWYGYVQNPKTQTLFNIAHSLGVRPDELAEYSDSTTKPSQEDADREA